MNPNRLNARHAAIFLEDEHHDQEPRSDTIEKEAAADVARGVVLASFNAG